MRVAIIPARKGSERAPGKNTAIINGLPLVEIAIKQAIRTGLFDKIIVSSNDPDVIEIANKYKVTVDCRDEELSGSKSPLIDMIRALINKYYLDDNNSISLLVVTNPLRSDEDIGNALNLFDKHEQQKGVVSVAEIEYPIEMAFEIDSESQLNSKFKNKTTRKQDFSTSYRWNDAIIIDSVKNWKDKNRKLFVDGSIPYVMPPERSFYIDYPWQLDIIKMLMESNIKKKGD